MMPAKLSVKVAPVMTFLTLIATFESAAAQFKTVGEVKRLDARIDALIPANAKIEQIADGFLWAEGPV